MAPQNNRGLNYATKNSKRQAKSCRKCQRKFLSDGPHHRTCDKCHENCRQYGRASRCTPRAQ